MIIVMADNKYHRHNQVHHHMKPNEMALWKQWLICLAAMFGTLCFAWVFIEAIT